MTYYTFPFGKYKGVEFIDIPSNYLIHAIESFDIPIELKDAIKNEMAERLNLFPSTQTQNPDIISSSKAKSIYRNLSKKYHPDVGGADVAMQALNEFYELLNS